ncbi:tRNA pseudouridine(38-40) synthase TruA [Clostridium magnum]|uniref:tRNA pseudouridine synthase A n=1 Tax=Clostridium magnum DSM 2767 TaxID=1121326 RepID=A0A162TYA4_9CLOT|nr:tRNA pseudouridine(38-40) synthase TruA [Clostridium magnum]KZL93207.1 tRNA pseudouridine synthase A [Clostridium magnum DSM 2767]SHI19552.1 tRNA pseudouridine38-40 synthase [Clostridium magnum DSM 2767]
MRNIKLTIEYDGTNYAGWQRQNNAVTIQQKVEEAIRDVTGKVSEVIGSSRTDSGVHAKGFVCNFLTESKIPAEKFKKALNSFLPEDIVILQSEEVEISFHARFNSIGKRYEYTIITGDQRPAIGRNYMYYFYRKLDIENMRSASKYILGTHDFSAFKNAGSSVKTSVRTIKEINIVEDGNMIRFIVMGDGFLYNMVRIIVGTLLEVGTGRFKPEYVVDILKSKDRSKAGKSVPANGLCLKEVFY